MRRLEVTGQGIGHGRGWETAFAASVARRDDPAICGRLVEGLVAAELRRREGTPHLAYWQGRTEIAFVTPRDLVEVKYQNHVSSGEFAWARAVVPEGRSLTVVTRQDNARDGNVRLVDLRTWLLEE